MDIDKLFESESLDGIADNVFGVVNNSVSEVKEMQRKKVAENVQLVVNALKKIESDISSRYDSVGNALEKRIITIKDGRDGADGSDGRNGRDGKNGRDGAPGPRGADGKNGLDGADGTDGVSVTNAHIDFDGSLVISLSSGHELNVGEVVAPALAEQIKVITNGGGTSQSVIDTLASLQAQITALGSAVIYGGLWNASTNTPALVSSVGTSGTFYIVSVTGSTNLNGITNWGVGDWAIFNGAVWQRVEGGADGNFTTLSASSTVTFSGLTASTALALDASKNVVSVTNTGSGSNVLATSPTITGSTLTGGTFSGTSVTDSGLTSGRVTYAGTAGLLQDSANLTFNGTTLTANTIGAFTLSGTVAGGGNQLNNVIIGTTTPLAGAFTTLSASGDTTLSTTSVGGGGLRYTGSGSLSGTGVGGEMFVAAGVSYYTSYNRTTSVYAPVIVLGSTVELNGAITLTGNTAVTGTLSATGNVTLSGASANIAAGTTTTGGSISNSTVSSYVLVYGATNGTYPDQVQITTGASSHRFSSTGLAVTGTLTSTLDATIQSLTVGRGGGAVLTNTAVGSTALQANTTGTSNVALGNNALKLATITVGNTAVGAAALAAYARTASTIGRNTAIGQAALSTSTDGVNNTAVGYNTLTGTTGNGNTALGSSSGSGITTGSANVIIGAYSGAAAPISATGSNYIVLSDGDGNIVASSKTAQTFALQGGTLSAGTGIAFPATQSASSNANTLDDYEEGNATLTLDGSTTSPTTPVTVSAFYTKIGKQVVIEFSFESVNTTGASGNIKITGLPFPIDAATTPMGVVSITGLGVIVPVLRGRYTYGTTAIGLMSAIDVTSPITMIAGAGKYVFGSLTYFT